MLLMCYLALNDEHVDALRERLALAEMPAALLVAHTAPELIGQVQSLPVRAVVVDVTWPRDSWQSLAATLRSQHPDLPLLALSPGDNDLAWWEIADELLRLDEPVKLLQYRLNRLPAAIPQPATTPELPPATLPSATLLGEPQFRQFAEIFAGMDEATLVETFISWVQQACRTARAVLLLRDAETGEFVCRAQRGLPSTLVPHCSLPQTAALCRWLSASGRVLLKESPEAVQQPDALAELTVLQASAAVPVIFDGQLVGILAIGPRLAGDGYRVSELEALFALGGQVAAAVQHCRLHQTLRLQQEMTEHMLSVIPTGAVVLGEDNRIAFANTTAARILGKTRATLYGADMRSLPSPLGDLAYETLVRRQDLPRRELETAALDQPLAVSAYHLPTAPPTAMLLIEDLSAQKRLEEERERRVNLEVLTNLVHYLAHELRNPLVSLSTFSNLAPTRMDDPDFKDFCSTVLRGEIGRINLILEQLLVLTDHVELQFNPAVQLAPVLDRVTGTEDMRAAVVVSLPVLLPGIHADAGHLETALTCMLRTAVRLSNQQTPATMKVEVEEPFISIRIEVPSSLKASPDRLLNPWAQLVSAEQDDVDLGLATAHYIIEQHQGTLQLAVADNILTLLCRLPIRAEHDGSQQEGQHDAPQSARRR